MKTKIDELALKYPVTLFVKPVFFIVLLLTFVSLSGLL